MSTSTAQPETQAFIRDRYTLLAYWLLAYFAYLQTTLGPLMPFLRDELKLSYTVSGLHLSAFALGMVLAGATGDRLARRWGRRRILWGGSGLMALGALLFIAARHAALTILAAFVMGYPGTLVMVMVQATLSDLHLERRATALTESNVLASLSAGLAPLLVGSMQRVGIGWRGALALGALVWGGLLLYYRREPVPAPRPQEAASGPAAGDHRLPPIFWVYWGIVFLVVSVEWCISFWGADFLKTFVGLSRVNASTAMSIFYAAMVIGRATGSRLTRRVPLERLLPVALTLALLGFLPFWLAPLAGVNVAGLFVAGLGVANLFPLTLSAASSAVRPHQTDTASGRIVLAAGSAILITPQVLGSLADQVGIQWAFGVVALFLVIVIAAIVVVRRQRR